MHLGLFTDSLADLSLDEMLQVCQNLDLTAIELGCGAWSRAPHIDVKGLLDSEVKRAEYKAKLDSYGITIAALNCSGNPLDPGYGTKHHEDTILTFKLAEKLGLKRVVMMSGLPGGCSEDRTPTWIVTSWPPENLDILKYQWEVTVKYWRELVAIATDCGIEKIALEPHGMQMVYNVETMRHLRAEVGGEQSIIGFNIDPSHPFWMGADPIEMVRELGELIYHCHVKDICIRQSKAAINTLLDGKHVHCIAEIRK